MQKIKTALISVSNKEGIVDFAEGLSELGIELISTGGTAKAIAEAGLSVTKAEDLTGFPEMLDGRVKTLHPKVHAGILALRSSKEHMDTLASHGIKPIDMVVVNLYPFRQTVAKEGVEFADAIENIDIGGPTMIRAAAKNYEGCAVVVSPSQYNSVLDEIKESKGLGLNTRKELMRAAFEQTASYDVAIQKYLGEKFVTEGIREKGFGKELLIALEKVQDCRYGENPHQKAAFYKSGAQGIADAEVLNGKELSFNNLNDLSAGLDCVLEFSDPCVVILKHTNPCGVAVNEKIGEAFKEALECDPVSAFGGIIAMNRKCDVATAKQITSFFNEVVAAPDFDEDALAELKSKKNLRVLKLPFLEKGLDAEVREAETDMKRVLGGVIVQDPDLMRVGKDQLNVVSKKKPSSEEIESMLFAWKIVKHVKSNAIVCVNGMKTVGIGAGQMNRVGSMGIALTQAGNKAKGAVIASDAFFPFRDSIDTAAAAGITSVIETGGSVKDEEVIAAADEHQISLVFTGVRHFKH